MPGKSTSCKRGIAGEKRRRGFSWGRRRRGDNPVVRARGLAHVASDHVILLPLALCADKLILYQFAPDPLALSFYLAAGHWEDAAVKVEQLSGQFLQGGLLIIVR